MEYRSESIGELSSALSKAQGQFPDIPKTKTAKVRMKSGGEYSYKYAGLADILSATRKALSSNNLALTQSLMLTDKNQALLTRLSHQSGEWISSIYPLPTGLPPQAFGSELTYARRYSACAAIGVEGDEDTDGDITQQHHKESKAEKKPAQKVSAPKVTLNQVWTAAKAKGYSPDEVGIVVSGFYKKGSKELTNAELTSLQAMISKYEPEELLEKVREKIEGEG